MKRFRSLLLPFVCLAACSMQSNTTTDAMSGSAAPAATAEQGGCCSEGKAEAKAGGCCSEGKAEAKAGGCCSEGAAKAEGSCGGCAGEAAPKPN